MALRERASRLQAAAIERHVSVATAESCTGGLVSHSITEIAGSSDYFRGGVVSYSNEAKVALLGVQASAIDRHGAVSAQVAVAMASGVRTLFGADYAVAVTGVAGPGGGSAEKPVGLTYVAVSGPAGDEARRYLWDGDRSGNKHDSARVALELLIETVTATPVARAS